VSTTPDTRQDPPGDLTAARHAELDGRNLEPWIRRLILLGCALIAIAALLGVFGQEPTTSRAASPSASIEVRAPDRVRGGLIFQARFDVRAAAAIARPVLRLERGWFDSMSVNSIEPSPTSERSVGDRVELEFEPVAAGRTMSVWIYFQANPTNAGRQRQRVELADGERVLAHVDRSVLVFP
jgi:hypothetical protein